MWKSLTLNLFVLNVSVTLLLIMANPALGAADESTRYRGKYIYGHEVNSFCPDINAQCYWIRGDTSYENSETLKKIYAESSGEPYVPVCIVIEGVIDRESERTGFSADFDGLMSISRIFGACDKTDIVTQGDLQHHRWVLTSIRGNAMDPNPPNGLVPELDFGEDMNVTGNSGCNRLSGQATLREEYFVMRHIASTRRLCSSDLNDIERTVLQVLGDESVIKIDDDRNLILQSGQTLLHFRLADWEN